eukprot:6983205-Alexandrium_andersonii.AAC.1
MLAACKSLMPQQIVAACRKWTALVRLQSVDDPADVKLEEGSEPDSATWAIACEAVARCAE